MSRQVAGPALATAAALAFPWPALAQQSLPPVTAEDVMRAAEAAYADPIVREAQRRRREGNCPPPKAGEDIVVCAQAPGDPVSMGYDRERAARDYAAKTPNRGNPRAPRMGPPPCVASLLTMCAGLGGPLPRGRLIDLAALPEAPAGSDADRIARGEMAE